MKREEAQTIAKWLNTTLLPMVYGLYDFAHSGDDGWLPSMKGFIDDVITVEVKNFIQDNLLPADPVSSTEKDYRDLLSRLSGKQASWMAETGEDLSSGEYAQLYKARLFNYLIHEIRREPQIENLKTFGEIFNYLESELLQRSDLRHKFYTDQYLHSGEIAIRDVATYILEQRAKAPQKKLF